MRWMLPAALAVGWSLTPSSAHAAPRERQPLREGWALRSSEGLNQGGEALSVPGLSLQGWHRASVPTTVVAALVAGGVYPDPHPGMNLRSLPGASYPIAKNFSHLPIPADSPFRHAWWYRTEFAAPQLGPGEAAWLHLDGVNFRANVWLNGQKIADSRDLAGTFRRFELELTRHLRAGAVNALAVEVFPPEPHDLALTWVDWNPMPPDKNMGLWSDVWLSFSGPVTLRHPQVVSDLEIPSLDSARLTVSALLRNVLDRPVTARLRARLDDRRVEEEVSLGPRESKVVNFTPEAYPALTLDKPRVWWPHTMGAANLYDLELEVQVDGAASDRQTVRFGVQRITSELTGDGHRRFKINGKNILIRGAGWASDMMLRRDRVRLEAELRYVRDMNLNTIRLEGKFEDEAFFDLADSMGILVMVGWCCCDQWEQWPKWDAEDRRVAMASQADQIQRLRNRPSVLVWLNGSDGPPPADVERDYLGVLRDLNWTKPVLSSAYHKPGPVSGPSGVKMKGPYEWVPPSYWYLDKERGGAYGFATELGPGPAVPPVESLERMLGKDHLWPIDPVWNFHCGGNEFGQLNVFTRALEARYGKATGVADYAWKAQAMTYEAQRAMFEAYGRNKYQATGVIQWMLNNAWPSLIWHLYDYYLRPAGGYFGTKRACEPLHVQYSYDDDGVVVVNDRQAPAPSLKVTAKVYDLDLKERFSREAIVDAPADGALRAFTIPKVERLTPTYFVRLGLEDRSGRQVSSNFYWLSTQPETLNWKKSEWFYTPAGSYADFTGLARLPRVSVRLSSECAAAGAEGTCRVRVENPTPNLAFMVRLRVTRGPKGDEVLPVFWEDNYFPLWPGEVRQLGVSYPTSALGGAKPAVQVDGWNVDGS